MRLQIAPPGCRCGRPAARRFALPRSLPDAPTPTTELRACVETWGLANWQVERLVRDLGKMPVGGMDVQVLKDKIGRLAAVAPPSPSPLQAAAALVCEDVEMLNADPGAIAAFLVMLKSEFGPNADAWQMLVKQPRILAMNSDQVREVLKKIVQIYPYKVSNKKGEVLKLCEEYPELLYRMPYYLAVKRVEDLPVDLQNRLSKSHCG